jgi:formate dehydrogenase (NADP+) alpha subunit
LDLLICQDPFLTETGQMAHIVLPASTYAEKDGTFTNLEGRVLRIRQTMDPIGESLPDWHIMTAVASGLGFPFDYESPQDIQNEIMKLLPGYYNLGQPRKMAPKPDAYLARGYVNEVKDRYRKGGQAIGHGRFALSMGQLLSHSGKLSTRAPGLMTICPNGGRLHMNVLDMERMELSEGGQVRVTTEKGSLEMGVEGNPALQPGFCFFPEHFNEPPVKDLMPIDIDPTTGVPSFKLASATIEKV